MTLFDYVERVRGSVGDRAEDAAMEHDSPMPPHRSRPHPRKILELQHDYEMRTLTCTAKSSGASGVDREGGLERSILTRQQNRPMSLATAHASQSPLSTADEPPSQRSILENPQSFKARFSHLARPDVSQSHDRKSRLAHES